MKKLDNKCTIVANSLILSDSVFLRFFKKAFENLKKARFIIFYYLSDQVDVKKNQINFEKKTPLQHMIKKAIQILKIY